jgi:Rieske Fe-S protein
MAKRPNDAPNRRDVLLGAGALGAGAVVTAGCGGSSSAPSDGPSESTTAGADPLVVKTSDVPVGGGLVDKAATVVITQPQPGQFHAFTAVCTHKQCVVSGVTDGKIRCPCHGSEFSPTDGSVLKGPAAQPLAAKTVQVTGDQLSIS